MLALLIMVPCARATQEYVVGAVIWRKMSPVFELSDCSGTLMEKQTSVSGHVVKTVASVDEVVEFDATSDAEQLLPESGSSSKSDVKNSDG